MAKKTKGLTVEVNGDITGLKTALNQAEDVVKRYEKQLKTLNKALNEDPTNSDNISKRQEVLKKLIEETTKEIEKYKNIQQQLDNQGVSHTSAEWMDVENRIIASQSSLLKYKSELSTLSPSMQAFNEKIKQVTESTEELANKLKPISTLATTALTSFITEAVSVESSIANIKKVVTDLSDSTVNDLKSIATQTGISFTEISDYASMAGTLGIAEKDISAFAKAMTDLNTATSGAIAGEDGAKSVARFLNLVDVGTDQVSNFGSALTGVADQFATTADEVLETSSAMAGLASVFNVDQYDIIGISAVLQSLGVSANVSASSMTKVFQTIELAVDGADEELELFAKTAGYSADEFTSKWESEPMQVLLDFADGLQNEVFDEIETAVQNNSDTLDDYAEVLGMTKEQFVKAFNEDNVSLVNRYADALADLDEDQQSAIGILNTLGLSGVRYSQTLLKLAGNGEKVRDAIEDANKAWDENTALTDKANTVYKTTEYKLKAMYEQLKQTGAVLGDTLLPYVNKAIDGVSSFAKWVSNLTDNQKKAIVGVTAFSASLSPLSKGISSVTKAVSNSISGFDNFNKKINKMLDATNSSSKGFTSFLTSISTLTPTLQIAGLAFSTAMAGASAFVIAMDGVEGTVLYDNQNMIDSFNEMGTAVSEAYAKKVSELEKSEESAKEEAENIDVLISKYQEEQKAGEVSTTTKENLQTAIENLNSIMGGSYYYWDEETGRIKTQKEEVENLTDSIENMYSTKRKEEWLETYEEKYNEMLETQTQMEENASKTFDDLYNRTIEFQQNHSDIYSDVMQHMNDGAITWAEYISQFDQGTQTMATNLKSTWEENEKANSDLDSINTKIQTASETIDNVKNSADDSWEAFANIADMDLDFSDTESSVSAIKDDVAETIDKLNYLYDNDLGETDVAKQLEQHLLDQDEALQALGTSVTELFGIDGVLTSGANGTFENINSQIGTTSQAIQDNAGTISEVIQGYTDTASNDLKKTPYDVVTEWENNYQSLYDGLYTPYSNALTDFKTKLDNTSLDKESTYTIHVKYDYSQAGSVYGNPWLGGSGGLSQSNGLSQSGGITLNNTFNVSSNGVTRTDVNSWAVQIADTVSEILGGRINV